MPALVNKIVYGSGGGDHFDFDDLMGSLQPKSQRPEIFVRNGRDGEIIRKTGIRGLPVTVRTLRYVADWTDARDTLVAYNTLQGTGPVVVWQHSISFGYWQVLDVAEESARACAKVIGSLVANPLVSQVCQWTLLSVEAP